MIESLINILKKYQNEPLDGFYMAKIEVKKPENETLGIVFKSINAITKVAIISEKLTDNQLIKLILIKTKIKELPLNELENIGGNTLFTIQFSNKDISQYLQKSGDTNTIHLLQNPVVPGLLIMEKFWSKIEIKNQFFNVKFSAPLLENMPLEISKISNNEWLGVLNKKEIINITTF